MYTYIHTYLERERDDKNLLTNFPPELRVDRDSSEILPPMHVKQNKT